MKVFGLSLLLLLGFSVKAFAQSAIQVSGVESGLSTASKLQIWHDKQASSTLNDAQKAFRNNQYTPFSTNHSTGLIDGTLWSHFYLENISKEPITLHIEYVDHQLITMDAYARPSTSSEQFNQIASLSLQKPFSDRQFEHNRFIFETTIAPGETYEYFVKYGSEGSGYIFPNLRIWEPESLRKMQIIEIAGFNSLIGGLLIMSTFALIVGLAIREKVFYGYSVYALAKIIAWSTIFGYTHQFVLTKNFHWSYISMSGAVTIFCGVLFSRLFLQTCKYTPRLDYGLLFMMANATFLFFSALFKFKALAVMSITLALLLYPLLLIAASCRWLQGSKEAIIFVFAWSFLVAGLVSQALRDLGFVEHNFFNYYWPPLASYIEMIAITIAMGFKMKLLREQKIEAQKNYRRELEQSRDKLERLVAERTHDLEQEKKRAQFEACTDSLTGTRNRRSFFADSEKLLEESKAQDFSLSLLMFDIDHFKNINDTYGHATGDEALKKFTRVISEKIRGTDIFGRLGGEEFSLLLCGNKEHALQMAERLREDISAIKIDTPLGVLKFTTSIGIAHLCKEVVIEELLNEADRALYVAKESGRNKIIEYPVC
jgi:diguanylate cyclase (GGDEF)-like protein